MCVFLKKGVWFLYHSGSDRYSPVLVILLFPQFFGLPPPPPT